MSFMNQADGSGEIDIDGRSWPVSYQVVSEDERDGARSVHIELSVPRDWLLERGFTSEAKLIRENGAKVDIRSPAAIGIGDPIAIRLRSDVARIGPAEDVVAQFPELTAH